MNFIKKIVTFFLNLIENFRFKKIIKAEDQKNNKKNIDQNIDYPHLNEIFQNGYSVIDSFVTAEEIDHVTKNLRFDRKKINWSYSNIIVKPKSIIEKILKDDHVKNILVNYLGNDAKLDSIEANEYKSNPNKVSSSEKWHYDVVGKRIKIFLFLNDCKSIFTEYVDGTNNISHNNFTGPGSRISNDLIKSNFNKITKIFPKKGSLFIFDTNGFHKGVYRNIEYQNNDDQRLTIQMEFSSKSKSDKLFNLKCDSIGVRNVFFSKDCDFKNYLLDKDYLNEFLDENIVFYDQQYSKN